MSLIVRYGPPVVSTVGPGGEVSKADVDLTKTAVFDVTGAPGAGEVDTFSAKQWPKALKLGYGYMIVGYTETKVQSTTLVGDYKLLSVSARATLKTPAGVTITHGDYYMNRLRGGDLELAEKNGGP